MMMMKMRLRMMMYLALIYTSLFLLELTSARSNSIREVRQNSLNRVSKGKRNWSGEPLARNVEQDITTAEESIPQSGSSSAATPGNSYWLELEGIPPSRVSVKLHSDITLECQGVGNPPPMIHWLKNGKPLDNTAHSSDEITNSVEMSRFPGTPIRGQKDFVMAKTKSKLPLLCIRPEDEGQYTCVADNDGRQVMASTVVVIEEDDPSGEIRPECEYKLSMFFNSNKKGKKGIPAYVLTAETLHMESIGNDVILPCRGAGRPKPKIQWIDADGQRIISGKKFQVNSNGNLLIRSLRWQDMGEYSCIADNQFGTDLASTFLYPLMTEGTS